MEFELLIVETPISMATGRKISRYVNLKNMKWKTKGIIVCNLKSSLYKLKQSFK